MNTPTNLPPDGSTYSLLLTGALIPGAQPAQVVQQLAELFKLPAEKVQAMLQQGQICLKKHLPLAAAQKYQQAIERAGAVVALVAQPAVFAGAKPPLEALQVTKPTAGQWTLTGLDEPLLKPQEQHPFKSCLEDYVSFDLTPQTGFILTEAEKQPVQPVAVAERNWQVAEAGALLLAEADKKPAATPIVPPLEWSLAGVGERLSQPQAQTAAAPDVSHLSVASI